MSGSQQTDASDLSLRPGTERAARYRELAEMHLGFAREAADPTARASHLELAGLWTRLASQAEHHPAASDP